MEAWRKQVESCMAAATWHIQQNPLWGNLSQWRSSLLQQSGLAVLAQNAGKHSLPLKKLLSPQVQGTHKDPVLACLSMSPHRDSKHLFDVALSSEDISQKLDGIPVYAVCKNSNEFVLVSDSTNQKSLGFFCFRRSEAEALLQQVLFTLIYFATWSAYIVITVLILKLPLRLRRFLEWVFKEVLIK